jgi:hypothetical protein
MANFLGLVMSWRGVCRVYPTVHNNREFDYGQNQRRIAAALAPRGLPSDAGPLPGMIAVSDQVKLSS